MKPPWPCLLGSNENLEAWGEIGLRVSCLELMEKARAGVEISVLIRLLSEMGTYSRFMIIALPLDCSVEGFSPAIIGELKIKAAAMVATKIVVNVFFVCPFFISLSPLFVIALISNARRVPEREIAYHAVNKHVRGLHLNPESVYCVHFQYNLYSSLMLFIIISTT
jgi:hypothetical protein